MSVLRNCKLSTVKGFQIFGGQSKSKMVADRIRFLSDCFTENLCALSKMSNGARGRTRTGTGLLPRDFKSLASANFATRASDTSSQTKVDKWRPGSDSNRRRRLCRPLHNPSATRPRIGDKSDFGFLRLW